MNITTDGHRHLGAVVGNEENKTAFVEDKVREWIIELESLRAIVKFQPHAAY